MSLEMFEKALDYISRSGMRQVRLMGGEPTLHPDFQSFVLIALDMDFDIMLFSNGLAEDNISGFLESIPDAKLTVLLNTIHPDEKFTEGIEQQQKFMKKLGSRIIPGVNIFRVGQKLDYLLEYVIQYHLREEVRIGISHSVLSGNNEYLHPKQYQNVGHEIVKFKSKTQEEGISIGFDCGFVPCMFPAAYQNLFAKEFKKAGNGCHPIIDMLSDGTFISCYPLHNLLKVKMNDEIYARDVIRQFNDALSPFSGIGIYPHCTSCFLFRKQCNGGCMSFRIQRYHN